MGNCVWQPDKHDSNNKWGLKWRTTLQAQSKNKQLPFLN